MKKIIAILISGLFASAAFAAAPAEKAPVAPAKAEKVAPAADKAAAPAVEKAAPAEKAPAKK